MLPSVNNTTFQYYDPPPEVGRQAWKSKRVVASSVCSFLAGWSQSQNANATTTES